MATAPLALSTCRFSARYGASPTIIVITKYDWDGEDGIAEIYTTNRDCLKGNKAVTTGGVMRLEGHFHKTSVPVELARFTNLTAVKFLADDTDASSRTLHFLDYGDASAGTLACNFKWTGECSKEGLQMFSVELRPNNGYNWNNSPGTPSAS